MKYCLIGLASTIGLSLGLTAINFTSEIARESDERTFKFDYPQDINQVAFICTFFPCDPYP
ncbi:hypothetical protein [Acaryochloris marina]|uniref:hypothetical protein n=1 Tax=Acaryochloris marina TaxID=155978 RepID=UPI0011D1060D|nr:hypothetical protein [Acaryochloris marina]